MKIGMVMDPISGINIKKDSSFAMLLAARARGHELYYMEQADLYLELDRPCAGMRPLEVQDDPAGWFDLGSVQDLPLTDLDLILMRKDPPVDNEYLVTTWILEHAQRLGVTVVNDPKALRDANEKIHCTWFPQLMAPTVITADGERVKDFLGQHGDIILKPLHSMGGDSIFRIGREDPNLSVILESMTAHGRRSIMAQKHIPAILDGDKRILMINGEAVPYALARIPATGETRGNLAAGGSARARELSTRDREICTAVGPVLRDMGLYFAGLDVIGDYLTEINVTSPTCIRELDQAFDLDIAGELIDSLVRHIQTQH
ncbi:MAG: glutathione synthase [Thiotrichales bacterium]|nr:glutathione synthase [Thiotrichales bacterium]